jgi:GT2 family glycosyltransferase
MAAPDPTQPLVGVVVLNYHQPEATLACIRSLLDREPASSRILWVENDADRTEEALTGALARAPFPWVALDPEGRTLPPPGTVGVLRNPGNLGYGAGNNSGLRWLHRAGVPYAWILNNDTELLAGSSRDLLAAAQARPLVGAWGTLIQERDGEFSGGHLNRKDFASTPISGAAALEASPLTYTSGCSLFIALDHAAAVDFIPEDYFLYYEDAAFNFELRRRGWLPSAVDTVVVSHTGSLSGGKRSALVEYYNRRNRWIFIQRYFPEDLQIQRRRRWHALQKWFFRGRFDRIRIDLRAYRDFQAGHRGQAQGLP